MRHSQSEISEVSHKLDLIIKLLAANTAKDMAFRDQIKLLTGLGLAPKDIAQILGKSSNHISVELSNMRKKGG